MRKRDAFPVPVIIFFVLFVAARAEAFSLFDRYEDVTTENRFVILSMEEVNDGKPHYYSFTHNASEIRFFVLTDNNGVLRAAFDACDVCYRSRKGYDQSGDFMICNNCGRRFHESRINVVKGGCNPSPLKRDYDEKNVRIKVSDIISGIRYFQ